MTNPLRCIICEEPAALPHCACPTCLAIAAGAVDPSDVAALVRGDVYPTEDAAFQALVITHLDAAVNGEARLGGGVL